MSDGYIQYSIAESNVFGVIDIYEMSCELRFLSELDSETHPAACLLVAASDEGSVSHATRAPRQCAELQERRERQ